jgi:hypothetical protein
MTETIKSATLYLSEAFKADGSLLLDFYSRIVVMAIESGATPINSQRGAENFIKFVFQIDMRDFTADQQEEARVAINLHPAIVAVAAQFSDIEYGWGWFCNLAMLAYDAGGQSIAANRTARDFMIEVFGFDVAEKFPERWEDASLQII